MFDIKETYLRFLREDPEMTMPVAAIESLVFLLKQTQRKSSSVVNCPTPLTDHSINIIRADSGLTKCY
jgi:hypothetical protein